MNIRYTEEMKNSIISKVINKGERSILSISKEVGIPQTTLVGWMKKYGNPESMKNKKNSKWTSEKKLQILIETGGLSEAELGAYLRGEGIFSSQLEEWKKEFIGLMNSSKKLKVGKNDEVNKIKSLEKEILRKDKALAEASALLILQKKANLIWGRKDEEEK